MFEECGFPLPPFTSLVFKPSDVAPQLAKLMLENIHVDRWVFKVDKEFEGRGIAFFDVSSSKKLQKMCKAIKNPNGEDEYAELQRLVSSLLPNKTVLVKPQLYKDYYDYIEMFCREGGVIEASPSAVAKEVQSPGVLFGIEPDGQVEIQSTFEKILSSPFSVCGFRYPQKCIPTLNVEWNDLGAFFD